MALGRLVAGGAIALIASCHRPVSTPVKPLPVAPPAAVPETNGPAAGPIAVASVDGSPAEAPDGGAAGPPAAPVARGAATRSDWPCPGCITRIPGAADSSRPMPVLVLFHGNDGNTHWMDRIWREPVGRHGVVELVLKCPGYGFPSWWRWHESQQHEPGWVRARIGELARELPIDMSRVFGTGYSGGASYLAAYASDDPGLFAAISLVAGGVPPRQCPSRAAPAHVLVGSVDTMLPTNVVPFREAWTRCGGEVVWDERAGVTHEGILWNVERGGAEAIVAWLLGKVEARPAAD